LGAGAHRVDDHGIISVDAQHADLEQIAVAAGTNAHREVVIELPLSDGVADGVGHIFVGYAVLSRCLRDAHGVARYLVNRGLSRNLVGRIRIKLVYKTANRPQKARKRLQKANLNRSPRFVAGWMQGDAGGVLGSRVWPWG
jgi:hypothetical protein